MPTNWPYLKGNCPTSCILIVAVLGLSSYAVGNLPDYVSEDANSRVHKNRVCGNGILEPGEECDCGPGVEKCRDDPCCQTNCQLKLHSQCSSSDPCCEKCKFKRRGTLCRQPENECRIPEYCSGDRSDCSALSFKKNGANCTGDFGRGICVHGNCKSFNQPCLDSRSSGSKCPSGSICLNQSCIPITRFVNGHFCPRGRAGLECSGHGECTALYQCHCDPGWKGGDCSRVDDTVSSNLDIEKPGIITGVGPEQRDSTSNTTALVGGLVSFVILVSVSFVVMGFRYLPSRTPKDDSAAQPQGQTTTTEPDPERPLQNSNSQ